MCKFTRICDCHNAYYLSIIGGISAETPGVVHVCVWHYHGEIADIGQKQSLL